MRNITKAILRARSNIALSTARSRTATTASERAAWQAYAAQYARFALQLTNVKGKPTKAQRKAAARQAMAVASSK